MAVFKANYVKKGKEAKERIKATIRYIQHRPGHDQARTTRTLFGLDGAITRHQAYRLIDEARKGSIFYRFVISPDPKKEDTKRDLHLREITEKTMHRLEKLLKQDIAWVAAEHTDHAPHRHVHLIAILKQKLDSLDFKYLRLAATEASLFQRQQLDLALGIRRQHSYRRQTPGRNITWGASRGFSSQASLRPALPSGRHVSRGVAPPRPKTCFCYHCGLRQAKSYFGGLQHCIRCGSELRWERKIVLRTTTSTRRERQVVWEL
jgi:hypothetical protein